MLRLTGALSPVSIFFPALLGASVSFSSFAVQANEVTTPTAQRWLGHGVVQAFSAQSVTLVRHSQTEMACHDDAHLPCHPVPCSMVQKPGDPLTFIAERSGDGFQIVSLTPQR
ncbi:copper-binding protein [Enterobacter sp.]|uniref:copper-binding protein n=1 Tax=Enterobacter sp. TaxID=42895 RepID=UPI00378492C9